MEQIVQKLSEDHHRFRELLDLLDEQMGLLDGDEEFDCQLTLGILDYVKYFPDAFHHPLEELIFDRLSQFGDLQLPIDKLRDEHLTLSNQTNECRAIFLLWHREGELSDKAKASELGKTYIEAQRRHIAFEELNLFPCMDRILTQTDLREIKGYAEVFHQPPIPYSVPRRSNATTTYGAAFI